MVSQTSASAPVALSSAAYSAGSATASSPRSVQAPLRREVADQDV